MFEKSLYDLIRGLRNHKGNEREYIQNSLRECRAEIRGSDMDLKATALLKLIYLEMFGHDMSWASFNVLEVMSSAKYLQKRVGYLGAVQSFRPDTEVLMLATNLLKKDITSPSLATISLPLVTLPHIIAPSLALSLMSDLLPRLSHSNPSIRKKTIVTLYRLALVYPEALRNAWPKIKDILMDRKEDPSVTAAVINVVCELGWRRPRDFLPLAPRLFDLLIDGGNNWMAIKIIKLFAILTPLEPRLIKKLLPPLITLIRTTPAMSLLYECINGIIQGGILEGGEGIHEGDQVAELCVGKLRGMIVVENDPNLKYVALLAFNKIVISHPYLVSVHQDVIMDCIDDPDISIRLQALDLVTGMISGDNLVYVVNRLMQQLREATLQGNTNATIIEKTPTTDIEPAADSDGEDPEQTLRASNLSQNDHPPMPVEYRTSIIRQILAMCSRNTYANITDFEWYIELLVGLVRLAPSGARSQHFISTEVEYTAKNAPDISAAIGFELRNVAVRVSSVRLETVRAASSIITQGRSQSQLQDVRCNEHSVLAYAAWIVGEYAELLSNKHDTLNALLILSAAAMECDVICAYIQAVPKILTSITSEATGWSGELRSIYSLLLARVIHFLEPLTMHPSLEVQERSVEFLELMRLAAEAVTSHEPQEESGPLLLINGIPLLFGGIELNPVAATAQAKVPLPNSIDLSQPISSRLPEMLVQAEQELFLDKESAESDLFYYKRLQSIVMTNTEKDKFSESLQTSPSYQQEIEIMVDPKLLAMKRAERLERSKNDPFYIAASENTSSGTTTPSHNSLRTIDGQDVDVDSIPIMDLDLGGKGTMTYVSNEEAAKPMRKRLQRVHVAADENIDTNDSESRERADRLGEPIPRSSSVVWNGKNKRSLLEVDSSSIGDFRLNNGNPGTTNGQLEHERLELERREMAKALAEVERQRMEMQRASERIQAADDIPLDGTLVKKREKKGKKKKHTVEMGADDELADIDGATQDGMAIKRKKRKPKIQSVPINKSEIDLEQ